MPAEPHSPELARATAEHLLLAGMPEQAFAELVREAVAAQDPAVGLAWHREAGALLWRAERWSDATLHFSALGELPDARLGLAWSLVGEERYVPAAAVLASLDLPEARYLGGFVALHQRDPAGAVAAWRAVPAASPLHGHATGAADLVASWKRVPHRAPGLAGVMSAVLPGSGQAYVGRWGEAASALVVNGLLIASAVELGRRDLWFGLGVVLVFETGFYGGNVMSAVNGARRFNRRAWEDRVGPVEGRYGMRLLPGDDGWVVATPSGN